MLPIWGSHQLISIINVISVFLWDMTIWYATEIRICSLLSSTLMNSTSSQILELHYMISGFSLNLNRKLLRFIWEPTDWRFSATELPEKLQNLLCFKEGTPSKAFHPCTTSSSSGLWDSLFLGLHIHWVPFH